MDRSKTTVVSRRSGRAGSSDRRRFLTDAGKYGALLIGGSAFTTTVDIQSAAAGAQGGPADAGRDVQEKVKMVRIFAAARRAPGLLNSDVRGKSFISFLGYGGSVMREAMKNNDTRQPLLFIQNFVNGAAYGVEGQTTCPAVSDRDFVGEYQMGIGDTVVSSVSGVIAPPPSDQPAAPGRPRRGPRLPDYGESGTELPIATRQVLWQGTRPLAVTGREKGMHFIKFAATMAAADQVKVWQELHAKALEATPAFARSLAGYELLQRLPDTPSRQPNRCGEEMPVPELVACFWSKTNNGAEQFPSYVRAFGKADQQAAIDGPASFLLLVEEWEVFMNPTFVG